MPKIKGKFAPLTDELGDDERFIIQSTDLDKLLYVLIIYTCHMTRHQAPKDPHFYKSRYGLRAKTGQIAASIGRLQELYPNVSWGEKKLSLLNSVTYKSRIGTEVDKESEGEVKKEIVTRETKQEPEKQFNQVEAFNEFWEKYPAAGRLKQSAARINFCETVISRDLFSRILKALKIYSHHLKRNEWKKAQDCPNWLAEWEDWENHKESTTVGERRELKPNPDCTVHDADGMLPNKPGIKCWCWS